MKLTHVDLQQQLLFNEFNICEWIIESPVHYLKFMRELYNQGDYKSGNFVLSDDNKEYDLHKDVEIIFNPFHIQTNERKIINKLYSELQKCAMSETLYLRTQEIIAALQRYFYDIEYECPYSLKMKEEIDIINLFKILDVQFIADEHQNEISQLIEYIKILAALMKVKLVIIVNAGSFFLDDEKSMLVKEAIYAEIGVLFIENMQHNYSKEWPQYIMDKDGCEI